MKKIFKKKSHIFPTKVFYSCVWEDFYSETGHLYILHVSNCYILFSYIQFIWKKAVKTRNILYWISNWKSFILLLSCSIMMAFYEILFPGPCFPSFLLGFSLFLMLFLFQVKGFEENPID